MSQAAALNLKVSKPVESPATADPRPEANEGATVEVAESNPDGEPKRSSRTTWILGAALIATIAGGATWWGITHGKESTDDAQVDAEVVAVPSRASGTVAHLNFTENQRVKGGELLAVLDDDTRKAELAQAEAALQAAQADADAADADARVAASNAFGNRDAANATLKASSAAAASAKEQLAEATATLASAEATLKQAQLDHDRSHSVYENGTISKAALDQSDTALAIAESGTVAARARIESLRSALVQAAGHIDEASARARQSGDVDSLVAQAQARAAAAHAQVGTMKAKRDLAALDLSYTRIVAPHDGVVTKKVIAEGQAVLAGQPIVQVVPPNVWVTANFKETQLENMRVGQPVTLSVDAFSSKTIRGEVESLSGGTGSRFTLLPPDNAAGNYTKVVQRVPVRIRVIALPAGVELRPGMNAYVTVNTRVN